MDLYCFLTLLSTSIVVVEGIALIKNMLSRTKFYTIFVVVYALQDSISRELSNARPNVKLLRVTSYFATAHARKPTLASPSNSDDGSRGKIPRFHVVVKTTT